MRTSTRAILASSVALAAVFAVRPAGAEESAWTCPAKSGAYAGQICQCLEARRPNGAGAKSISEFVCPEGTMGDQDVAYRVVLDLEFRKTDKEAEGKLKELQSRGGRDVVKMETDVANWFDATSPDAEFSKKYSKTCADLSDPKNPFRQTIDSLGAVSTDGSTGLFAGNEESCEALVTTKLAAYKKTARIFATQNVVNSYKDDKKGFIDQLKDLYRNFLMKWMVYIGEFSRIKDKWNEKTPNVIN